MVFGSVLSCVVSVYQNQFLDKCVYCQTEAANEESVHTQNENSADEV